MRNSLLLLKRKLEQKVRNHPEALCCNDKLKGPPGTWVPLCVRSHSGHSPLLPWSRCSHTRKLSYCQIHPLGHSSYMTSRTETNKATSELGGQRWHRLSTWDPSMIRQEQLHSSPVREGIASGGMQPLPPPPTSPSVCPSSRSTRAPN